MHTHIDAGNFVYVDVALAFSLGHPFRLPVWYNVPLSLAIVAALVCWLMRRCVVCADLFVQAFNIGWFWSQDQRVQQFWSIVPMPLDFMGRLFGLVIGTGCLILCWELICSRLLQPRDMRMHESY
jgi:hypothetical protein